MNITRLSHGPSMDELGHQWDFMGEIGIWNHLRGIGGGFRFITALVRYANAVHLMRDPLWQARNSAKDTLLHRQDIGTIRAWRWSSVKL